MINFAKRSIFGVAALAVGIATAPAHAGMLNGANLNGSSPNGILNGSNPNGMLNGTNPNGTNPNGASPNGAQETDSQALRIIGIEVPAR